jgi:hypothetical protein
MKVFNEGFYMKRLSALAVFVLFFSFFLVPFCAAQTQTGNASYNASKTGMHISHPSLSFNTRVRVTNLRNNRSVEAIVNGRIPISPDRIADISGEAGDALGMAQSGMTQVEIEVIPFIQGVAAAPAPAAGAVQAPPPAAPAPTAAVPPPPAASPVPAPVPAQAPVPPAQAVTTLTEVQYVPVPQAYPAQAGCGTSPLIVILLILILLTLLIFILLLILFWRRFPFWPWRYPLWIRRHVFFARKRRR